MRGAPEWVPVTKGKRPQRKQLGEGERQGAHSVVRPRRRQEQEQRPPDGRMDGRTAHRALPTERRAPAGRPALLLCGHKHHRACFPLPHS